MRIEIQIGNDEPKIYPLKESKLIIGSGEAANILIPASFGISRKHLQITSDGDQFFVTDLGSANGTFMNEERLVPGTKKEFTSFFPVKLADDVTIALLGDDEPMPEGSSLQEVLTQKESSLGPSPSGEKTQLIARNNIQSNLKKSVASKKVSKQNVPQKKKKSKINGTYLFAFLIVAAAAVYQFVLKPEPEAPLEVTKTQEAPPPTEASPKVEEPPKVLTPIALGENEFPELSKLELMIHDIKCATTLEKKLCELIPQALMSGNGVIESMDKIVVILPEEKWFLETLLSFPFKDIPPSLQLTPQDRSTLLTLHLLKALPPFEWKTIEKNLFFAFYVYMGDKKILSTVIGMKPLNIELLLPKLNQEFSKLSIEGRGKSLIPSYREYFKVIKETEIKN